LAEKKKLEYFLLRYVPDAVKGEFVNFGLVAIEHKEDGAELVDVRITKDWGRVRCLDPDADLDLLSGIERAIREEVGFKRTQLTFFRKMEDSFSGIVQVSGVMPALTEQLQAVETETVAKMFLETVRARRTQEPSGRRKILETMRDAFEDAGVMPFLNSVPTEPYTKAGDPFAFDFGYNTGKEMRLFHAVSMKASVDAAVMLAARFPKIAPAMAQRTEVPPILTAVVVAGLDRSRNEVGFALEMMQESQIVVAETSEMAALAERARVELRV